MARAGQTAGFYVKLIGLDGSAGRPRGTVTNRNSAVRRVIVATLAVLPRIKAGMSPLLFWGSPK